MFLASGNAYSFHGDFINGWIPEAAENMLLATDKRNFQVVEGPNSEMPTCTPADADPENGTSDYVKSLAMKSAADSGSDTGGSRSIPTAVVASSTSPTSQYTTESKRRTRSHHRPGKH